MFLLLELSLCIPNPSVSFCISHSENSPSYSRSESCALSSYDENCASEFLFRELCLSVSNPRELPPRVPTQRAMPLCSHTESCASVLPLREQSPPLTSNKLPTKIRLTLDINNNPQYAKPADTYKSAGFITYIISARLKVMFILLLQWQASWQPQPIALLCGFFHQVRLG